jgi:transcriptional regulator with XRE-family HTH domain
VKITNQAAYRLLIQRLTAARKEAGWTQTQLGERLGLRQTYISKIETFELRLDVVVLVYWARALQLDAKDLVGELADGLGRLPTALRRRAVLKPKGSE